MSRYNSFAIIHKALRAMLYDTALTIQQTYFPAAEEANVAIEKIETVLYQFERHAQHEDHSIFPLVETYEHQLVQDFEKEHVKDLELGNRLKHLINIFAVAEVDEEQIACGSAISKSFVEFMIFNLEHMAKEEILINQALWKHYTDEQIIKENQKMVADIPAGEKILTAKWIIRAVNNMEAINWLKSIRSSSPNFVFQSLFSFTDTELSPVRKKIVQDALLNNQSIEKKRVVAVTEY